MLEIILLPELSQAISQIYETMETEYDKVAEKLGHTCRECPDNCCDSYFLHHTYCEWAYLWQGIRTLDDSLRSRIMARATEYVKESKQLLEQNIRPQIMCPCNENGLCMIYSHRLMICRMHGIPATLTRPDGKYLSFPGCWRCQNIVDDRYKEEHERPSMDRTRLFHQLAQLESRLFGEKRYLYPRLKLTIGDMIASGPPRVNKPHCTR